MLKQKLESEHLIDYIYDILNSKECITDSNKVEKISHECLYINKDAFEGQEQLDVFDGWGELVISLSPLFINEYSQDDYLRNPNLFKELEEKIQQLVDYEYLVLE